MPAEATRLSCIWSNIKTASTPLLAAQRRKRAQRGKRVAKSAGPQSNSFSYAPEWNMAMREFSYQPAMVRRVALTAILRPRTRQPAGRENYVPTYEEPVRRKGDSANCGPPPTLGGSTVTSRNITRGDICKKPDRTRDLCTQTIMVQLAPAFFRSFMLCGLVCLQWTSRFDFSCYPANRPVRGF